MEVKMEISRNAVVMINHVAQTNISSAYDMLMGINLVLGTKYYFLNRRVVFDDQDGKCRDAYANSK
jgi:hypothetical protein